MSAYYRITIGTGFYWCRSFVIKTDYPTTDCGALVDCLIDYLVEQNDPAIADRNEYEWSEEEQDAIIFKYDPTTLIFSDKFVHGGNCGDVLMHYGTFEIREVKESEINEEDEIVEVA